MQNTSILCLRSKKALSSTKTKKLQLVILKIIRIISGCDFLAKPATFLQLNSEYEKIFQFMYDDLITISRF